MNNKTVAPFGQWVSPLSSARIAQAGSRLLDAGIDERGLYWLETRPGEGGRYVLVHRGPDGGRFELPSPMNVRSRVHEYGGGAWCLVPAGVVFVNFSDQRLMLWVPGEEPAVLTPELDVRYADFAYDGKRNRLVCVREDHRGDREAVNEIVALTLSSWGDRVESQDVLVSGHDFFASPVLSKDGDRLAWLCWDHPDMPWDSATLYVGQVREDGAIGQVTHVAGSESESVEQPTWAPGGDLVFVSDRSGWWNLYRWRDGGVQRLWEVEAEVGIPMWVFGGHRYALLGDDAALVIYDQDGLGHMATVTWGAGDARVEEWKTGHTFWSQVRVSGKQATVLAGSSSVPIELISLDLETGRHEVVVSPTKVDLSLEWISSAQPFSFPAKDGSGVSHALYYPPKSPTFRAPQGDKPPLVVMSHGGPTTMASPVFKLEIQFWTTRGFAVVDVNYGGSSGFGRAYRERLKGKWGEVDIDDCVSAAQHLVDTGRADGEKLAIRGGSAGGYTTLAALTFRDVFKVGASYYGVSDLEGLAKDTHKFESRYLDGLVAPYPERRDVYTERSPIHHAERLSRPVIFFQGAEDRVVPPNQAEKMVQALRDKGVPVAYVLFEGEQHGFRRGESIRRALDAELLFYLRVFGLEPAEELAPLRIDNLDD